MGKQLTEAQKAATLEAVSKHGINKAAIGRELGLARSTVQHRLEALGLHGDDVAGGEYREREVIKKPIPEKGKVATYLISAATNNTKVHPEFWRNLNAIARHYEKDGPVEIMIGRIRYNLPGWQRLGGDERRDDDRHGDVWYDPLILPHVQEGRVELAPGLHWCGDCPNTATAVAPLSGLETFAGANSGIFAATKLQMQSVATGKSEPAKHNWTTGAVTLRHYSETKTGQKASFHHTYCALLVEVDSDGDWFVRHLIADDTGLFYDYGIKSNKGAIEKSERPLAFTPGDLHARKLDDAVKAVLFGPSGLTDQLMPLELHCHDTHDHESGSHHNRRKPFTRFKLHKEGMDCVRSEIAEAAAFYQYVNREWLDVYDVWSNHSAHIMRWLEETDWRTDPPNVLFYLDAARELAYAYDRGETDFNIYEWACRREGCPDDVTFLKPDQSHKVADIECGMHGDQGPNGARGSIRNIARTGAKSTIGHSHSAGIFEGCWQTGVTAGKADTLDMGYNAGPSSWSRTGVLTYPNGKRTMVMMRGLKWRCARK